MTLPNEAFFAAARSVFHEWPHRLIISVFISAFMWIIDRIAEIYGYLLDFDEYLGTALLTLILLDFASGIAVAIKNGESLESWGFARTVWKMIMWFFLIVAAVVISNAADRYFIKPLLGKFDVGVFFTAMLIEGKSLYENFGALGIWKRGLEALSPETDNNGSG